MIGSPSELRVLGVEEMYACDRAAIDGGISGDRLMEAAGAAVVREIRKRWTARRVLILCGPGNNGGDGFVVARKLSEAGWPVRVALLGTPEKLRGDAALNARRWEGPIRPLEEAEPESADLVVDALFGAGLARAVEGPAAAILREIGDRGIPSIAVDVPSGVHGDTGAVLGTAIAARLTVTFFRLKPGHLLLPGRDLCGETVVADIGIPPEVLNRLTAPPLYENAPPLWVPRFPWPRREAHKYSRGHVLIAGGEETTGAARLAARGAMRMGAGLVTIASPPAARSVYATSMPGALIREDSSPEVFRDLLSDRRKNAILLGPGGGVGEPLRRRVLAALETSRAVVLDADAITAFQGDADRLIRAIHADCVLTPHEGEFARLFETTGARLADARRAAAKSGAVVLLKGPDTIIAAPDGRAVINTNAPPELATAGSGDVLAGMCVALLAQGANAFDAACAAAWLHGAAAAAFGPGLIAEDIPEMLPTVLRNLEADA